VVRKGRPVRPFTPEEDALITRLSIEGLSPSEIGRRVDRKPNSITGRLATLARIDELQECAA
jgi:hypothetical protein